MTSRNTHVLRLRREGYKIWRIAELANISTDDVMEILVDAGLEQEKACKLTLFRERKPDRETTKELLARMRASRRKINQARRIGGGTWSGRNA